MIQSQPSSISRWSKWQPGTIQAAISFEVHRLRSFCPFAPLDSAFSASLSTAAKVSTYKTRRGQWISQSPSLLSAQQGGCWKGTEVIWSSSKWSYFYISVQLLSLLLLGTCFYCEIVRNDSGDEGKHWPGRYPSRHRTYISWTALPSPKDANHRSPDRAIINSRECMQILTLMTTNESWTIQSRGRAALVDP